MIPFLYEKLRGRSLDNGLLRTCVEISTAAFADQESIDSAANIQWLRTLDPTWFFLCYEDHSSDLRGFAVSGTLDPATVLKLRLPIELGAPGAYCLLWSAVDPRYQHRGIGLNLLELRVKHAAAVQAKWVYGWTRRHNDRQRRLWSKFGWNRFGARVRISAPRLEEDLYYRLKLRPLGIQQYLQHHSTSSANEICVGGAFSCDSVHVSARLLTLALDVKKTQSGKMVLIELNGADATLQGYEELMGCDTATLRRHAREKVVRDSVEMFGEPFGEALLRSNSQKLERYVLKDKAAQKEFVPDDVLLPWRLWDGDIGAINVFLDQLAECGSPLLDMERYPYVVLKPTDACFGRHVKILPISMRGFIISFLTTCFEPGKALVEAFAPPSVNKGEPGSKHADRDGCLRFLTDTLVVRLPGGETKFLSAYQCAYWRIGRHAIDDTSQSLTARFCINWVGRYGAIPHAASDIEQQQCQNLASEVIRGIVLNCKQFE